MRWAIRWSIRSPSIAPDLPSLIEGREVITPKDLEQTYGLTGGHIFHGELALDQLFTMRPLLDWAQYRTPIKDLYLCGSGTHPGTGLNGVSGANAAREIGRSCETPRGNIFAESTLLEFVITSEARDVLVPPRVEKRILASRVHGYTGAPRSVFATTTSPASLPCARWAGGTSNCRDISCR